jgi:serine/threonine protein kinase
MQSSGRRGDPEPTRFLSGQFPFLTSGGNTNELGRLGPYRILKVLGEGGMGVVFQAQDSTLERLVALKVMKPEASSSEVARKRFHQEARAAASIQHDHIVTIYHVGEDNGTPYLAMPFLAGESLESRLGRRNRLSVTEILRIGREVADGLAAAHARGMIHRDIKPANIWLEDLGPDIPPRVKILDFGLARVGGDQFQQHLTRTGFVMGTPGYMAPEQARAMGRIDHRCDLFSLGCVLYHMVTGREPFQREDVMATLMALALDEPPPIRQFNPEAPHALADLVNKLMAKNPDGRPTTMGSVCKALLEISRSLPKNQEPNPKSQESHSGFGSSKLVPGTSPSSGELKPTPEAGKPDTSRPSWERPRPSWERPRPSWERPRPVAPGDSLGREVSPPASGQHPAAASAAVAGNALSPTLESTGAGTVDTGVDFGHCPRCGTPYTSSANKGWCLSCGYMPEKEEAPAEVQEKLPAFGKWCWYLLAGVVGILVLSTLGDLLLPRHCAARAWWGTLQLGLGVAIVIIADILAYLYILPTGTQVSFVEALFPVQLWISTFELLPKTRRPVCLLGWGVTTILAAVLLVGGQFYWFKKHPIHNAAAAASSKDEEKEKDDLDSEVEPFDSPEESMEKKGELEGLDADDETDTDKDTSRPLRGQYVVVGYIPGENQGIAGLVIASHGDGKLEGAQQILFSSGQMPSADASRIVSGLKVVADPPVGAANIKAIWVEPKQSCVIAYDSIDENGVIQNPAFKKLQVPKKPAEPK